MRVAYFDCFSGISGDMTLGALIDLGVSAEELVAELNKMPLPAWTLEAQRVTRRGICATDVRLTTADTTRERSLREIYDLVEPSGLDDDVKQTALRIFDRIAEAEARVHGTTPDRIHFHELGGLDSVIDIVGAVIGLKRLGVEEVHASALPMSRGFVQSAHGVMPVPAPATAELLKGVPVYPTDIEGELVTPTGAGILVTLAKSFGQPPPLKFNRIGYGSGKKEFRHPNLLRVMLAETVTNDERLTWENLTLLETNVDDMNPEFFEHVMERAFATGALDVFLTPIQMKKNRPAVLLSVLTLPQDVPALLNVLWQETTTIGVRVSEVKRVSLPREVVTVTTPFGAVHVKVARCGGQIQNIAPEYEDCKRAAARGGVPLSEVYWAALNAAKQQVKGSTSIDPLVQASPMH
ncbi:MAG: nickel pincer cofactor biosynthesis protein LarC [Abditibacteriales bacterium]|nr:nickel pincer cofactor biosynthesis protein LarC [Abditibacteriales bacterium]MDW8368145.1 nickel pincer cofactor biosynthesis protein LarC [Abditibacteriales bacterium]